MYDSIFHVRIARTIVPIPIRCEVTDSDVYLSVALPTGDPKEAAALAIIERWRRRFEKSGAEVRVLEGRRRIGGRRQTIIDGLCVKKSQVPDSVLADLPEAVRTAIQTAKVSESMFAAVRRLVEQYGTP